MRKKSLVLFVTLFVICLTVFFGGKSIVHSYNLKPFADKNVDMPANKKIIDSTAHNENVQANSQESKDVRTLESKQALGNATFVSSQGKHIIKDPDDLLVIVNKSRNLPSDWVPKDLVAPNVAFAFKEDSPRRYMRAEAARALEELFNQARKDNIRILATSGYRSFATQKRIFESNAKRYGEAVANQSSAYPGQSEHQTGLAMDVTSASVNYKLEESFGQTAEGKWLKENAANFGFIIRYPKGKENITKYNYEPWHIRYVGKETAKAISDKNITLEEYFNAVD